MIQADSVESDYAAQDRGVELLTGKRISWKKLEEIARETDGGFLRMRTYWQECLGKYRKHWATAHSREPEPETIWMPRQSWVSYLIEE